MPSQWPHNRIMFAHPFIKTSMDHVATDSQLSRPLGYRLRRIADGNNSVSSSVIGLINITRPSTVIWGIAKRVIHSIKRHTRRWITHISQKYTEIVAPRLTNTNASPTVTFIHPVSRLIATTQHVFPSALGSWVVALAFVMRLRPRIVLALLSRQTPAGLRSAFFKFGSGNQFFTTASANAAPSSAAFIRVFNAANGCQAVKNLSGKVLVAHHVLT